MTDHKSIPTEDHLFEARWHLHHGGEMEPMSPARPIIMTTAQTHALVSIAETLRLGELRRLIESDVYATLAIETRQRIMTELQHILEK